MTAAVAGLVSRRGSPADAAAIAAIYNAGILERLATFETTPRTEADITAWFEAGALVVVAVDAAGTVAGYAAASAYRARPCYGGVREFSVYVRADVRGKGIGRLCLGGLLDVAPSDGVWKLVSRLFPENTARRRLCAALGFREVGTYRRHARLDGVWRDVLIVEKLIGEAALA